MSRQQKTALIMAGGTGGHIFPGVAVAQGLVDKGWRVVWLGSPGTTGKPSMESVTIPALRAQGLDLPFEAIEFGGLRGKGLFTKLLLPFRLMQAFGQSRQVLLRVQPDVVIGMGGYISFPAGLMARLQKIPLVLHEQNSVAGLANKVLARFAAKVFTAFPNVLTAEAPRAAFIGNPLRTAFTSQTSPQQRFANRFGVLEILVVGGSLGAKGLNDLVPKALALIPLAQRPRVTHQSGAAQLDALQENYLKANVAATCTAFIEDTAKAFAKADIVIARAGASTVTEIAAVGAAALFVPFPFAVDDHQTTNAKYLVDAGAAWMEQQADLNPQMLADFLQTLSREELLARAQAAQRMARLDATEKIVAACEELAT
ncbi:MAG: undecaprenyldiphospho-muramoylpentapeptide beta-N-acetylglucosaminyltransferase [Cytophagales bacterium]|nr:undecaprenyldiphospho-muramoylpentapeptide beta-N-acetylglucosaminyltransferase [Cytophagales bacterium]